MVRPKNLLLPRQISCDTRAHPCVSTQLHKNHNVEMLQLYCLLRSIDHYTARSGSRFLYGKE